MAAQNSKESSSHDAVAKVDKEDVGFWRSAVEVVSIVIVVRLIKTAVLLTSHAETKPKVVSQSSK